MRVQGDTLDQQRSAEPTPEPVVSGNSSHKNSPSGLVTSSRSSSANSSHKDRDTPSPYKSELAPGSRSKRLTSGNDSIDNSRKVTSPLENQHTQSGSVPSLNLSSSLDELHLLHGPSPLIATIQGCLIIPFSISGRVTSSTITWLSSIMSPFTGEESPLTGEIPFGMMWSDCNDKTHVHEVHRLHNQVKPLMFSLYHD